MAKARTRTKTEKKPPSDSEKLMQDVQKVHGANIIRRGSVAGNWKHIPTGVFAADMAMFGGMPRSQLTMSIGWESSGKTLMAMRTIANAQRLFPDMKPAFIDFEGTYDPAWGAIHGIDNDNLLYVQPEYGEQGGDIAVALLRSRDVSAVVIDSLPAMMPHKVAEKSLEDDVVALQARLMDRYLKLSNQALIDMRKQDHMPVHLIVNQWRSKIAFMGDTRNAPGGNALKFFVFNRFEMLNKEELGKDEDGVSTVMHNTHTVKITKNKEGTGIRQAEFKMIRDPNHPRGPGFIDDAHVVQAYAKKFGLWTGAGANQRFEDLDMSFRTMQEGQEYLYDNPDYYEALKDKLISMQRARCGLPAENWK